MADPKEIDMAQPRRIRSSKRDPYSTKHSANIGDRIPHADKVASDDPDRSGILITLHRFELAGVEIDDRAVEIATKLTRWHVANADERERVSAEERDLRLAEAQARDCWVYYIRCGHLIKIGMTTNLPGRFASLRPNEVLAIEPGGLEREGQLHRQFEELRAGGEYFHPGPLLQQHIVQLRELAGSPKWTASVVPDGQDWFPADTEPSGAP
ncbi:GIY-YIG nuclease family protein [Streptomyces sp. NPDC096324]|uniref:GIY-YIG nuclease family protein n=1 Tax=Streptomyces sp. NPDC096324 TaxID=3366085 RepID=UPI0037FB6E46